MSQHPGGVVNWPFRGLAAWLLAKWACFPGKPQDSGQTLPAGLPETGLRLSPLLPATCGMGTLPLQEGGTERSHSQAGPEKKRRGGRSEWEAPPSEPKCGPEAEPLCAGQRQTRAQSGAICQTAWHRRAVKGCQDLTHKTTRRGGSPRGFVTRLNVRSLFKLRRTVERSARARASGAAACGPQPWSVMALTPAATVPGASGN